MLFRDNAFWRFSLHIYATPGVAEECLSLQRTLKIDVNTLLFCVWLGTRRISISEQDIKALAGIVGSWHDQIVRRLRAIRENMKIMLEMEYDDVKMLRDKIAATELEAEQIEQALLFMHAEGRWPRDEKGSLSNIIRANLLAFLRSHDRRSTDGSDHLVIELLVKAAIEPIQ